MKRQIASTAIVAAAIFAGGMLAAQDRSLTTPNGITFSELEGYEAWPLIATSIPDDAGGCGTSQAPGCIKAITGNAAMIEAYRAGIPANGTPVPDGAAMAKIEWQKDHTALAYPVTLPGPLAEVSFMVKDSKRFPDTNGWGYATFRYDPAADAFNVAFADDPAFTQTCHGCHTAVRARDFVWTSYAKR